MFGLPKWAVVAATAVVSVAILIVLATVFSAPDAQEAAITDMPVVTSQETITSEETVQTAEAVKSVEPPAAVQEIPEPAPAATQEAPAAEKIVEVATVVETVTPAAPAAAPAAEAEPQVVEVVEKVEAVEIPEPVKPAPAAQPEKPALAVDTPPAIEEVAVEEEIIVPAATAKIEKPAPKIEEKIEVVEAAPAVKPVELAPQPYQMASKDVVAEAKAQEPVVIVEEETVETTPAAAEPQHPWLAGPIGESNDIKPVSRSITLDGVGGGFLTQTAYLLNPEPAYANIFGKPSFAVRFTAISDKDIETFSVAETLFGRIELGYTINRLGIGNLDSAIKKATGTGPGRDDIWLHVFNIRGLLLKETKYLPAITAGVQFRINDGIKSIDSKTGGMLNAIGVKHNFGIDYTLFMSKTFAIASRPLSVTGGVRFTQAADMGYFGFGDSYKAAFEGNVSYQLADWLVLGYEIKQNPSTISEWKGVIENEDIWQAITANVLLGNDLSVQAAYGMLGKFANSSADNTWSLQVMYKF